ncbi:MAG: DUF1800 domain-containing protein [bacterium]|nr:DUF1800 domain-containing protein [Planctomycetota bacterium]HIL50923.1 DUF1800 domain-containing protein [Planctomycetota bacterium]
MNLLLPSLFSLLAFQPAGATPAPAIQESAQESAPQEGLWTRRAAEHLFNRAGFGATVAEIERALRLGHEATVDELLDGGREAEPIFYALIGEDRFGGTKGLDEDARRDVRNQVRRANKKQESTYTAWWIDRMVAGDDPLRDRMTLFWHGLFTTSSRDVPRSFALIQQHQLLRNNAIESYATLLYGIVRDPAMLYYLDNTKNKKRKPNENLARELMELFSLGEGNYTENDVKEVARALTGNHVTRQGGFRFNRRQHDRGRKTIIGQTGLYGGKEVVRILLEQDACSRWISGRIIEYLEGRWPDEQRHAEYAARLLEDNYELRPFLRKLLLDERFFREAVVGTRVMAPIDFLVGVERRLDLDVSSRFVFRASRELGQTLFQPPSVKGWDGGEAWITTASLLGRGNAAGMMLGVLETDSTFDRDSSDRPKNPASPRREDGKGSMDGEGDEMDEQDEEMEMGDRMDNEDRGSRRIPRGWRSLKRDLGTSYEPQLNLTWRLSRRNVKTDGQIVELLLNDLLAIEVPRETSLALTAYFAWVRKDRGLEEGQVLSNPGESEPLLRGLAHLILSLPEAQLN